MRKSHFILLFFLFCLGITNGASMNNFEKETNDYTSVNNSAISLTDTIFLNLGAGQIANDILEFDVFIRSDEQVSSVDFQFFFNTNNFTFLDVVNLAGLDQVLGFVNFDAQQGELEFRFTSNTFPEFYPNNIPLVKLRFSAPGITEACALDILTNQNSVVLMNGEQCSIAVLGCSNPPANAGQNQNICSDNALLSGNAPLFGTGIWTVVAGTGVFADDNAPQTTVSGLSPGQNVFAWTFPGSPVNSDQVIIFRFEEPINVNAGVDISTCDENAVLNATNPSIGVGTWSLISGSGLLTDETNPNTSITELAPGNNFLIWSVVNGNCPAVIDTLLINRISPIDAGPNEIICANETTLNATQPDLGSGFWTVIQGTGLFSDESQPNTAVTGLSEGLNIFRWTVVGGGCIDSTDDVEIIFSCNTPPITINQSFQINEDTQLAGNYLSNGDFDPDLTPLIITQSPIFGPLNGSIVVDTDGAFLYTPNPNFFGLDTIVVIVCDNGNPLPPECSNDTLFIEVFPINDPPIIVNELYPVFSGIPFSSNHQLNDSDIENTALSSTIPQLSGPSNGTFSLNANGTFTYTANIGFSGIDTVIVEVCDSGFPLPALCDVDTLVFVVSELNLNVFAGNDTTFCAEAFNLQGSPIPNNASGLWSSANPLLIFGAANEASTSVSNLQNGPNIIFWSVTLNGATVSDTVIVTLIQPDTPNAGPDLNICGLQTELSGNIPVNGSPLWTAENADLLIESPSFSTTPVSSTETGVFNFYYSISLDQCNLTDTIQVNFLGNVTLNVPESLSICENELPFTLPIVSSGTEVFNWSLLSGSGSVTEITNSSVTFEGLTNGENTFLISAGQTPCAASDTLRVNLLASNDPLCSNSQLFIPNGFSPNGDGVHDVFFIENLNGILLSLRVFNRWGELVYESDSYQNDWNGVANQGVVLVGEELPEGIYFYLIQIPGETDAREGYITIWR